MQALLPYLKQIAEALISRNKEGDKKGNEALSSIEKTISVSTAKQTSTAAEGNANTSAIGATLEKGLLLTVEEEQGGETVQVVKSVFQVIMDSILAKMEDALFVTVTENNQQVRKSLAQLVLEHNAEIVNIRKALDGTTANGIGAKVAAIDTKIGTMNTTLDGIKTAQEGIEDALDGTTTGGVADKLNDIDNAISGIAQDVESIDTNIGTMNTNLNTVNTRLGSMYTFQRNTMNNTADIKTNTDNIQVTASLDDTDIVDKLDDIEYTLEHDIYPNVYDINRKTPDSNS